ncbi:hypothetical protein BH09BAC2_BH09BAC2_23050 [soil metagenome]
MKRYKTVNIIILVLLFSGLSSYGQSNKKPDYLISFNDADGYGYKNKKGDIVIPPGKYSMCFTHIFKTYAFVAKPGSGFLAIDRKENILYEVFPYDNGPDYTSGGLFRIVANKKIGYASAATGKVVIKPQFTCAWPFKNGVAKVSIECTKQSQGEHTGWLSNSWYYIDKTGKKFIKPKRTKK